MYKIMAIEIDYKKGRKIFKGDPRCVEIHKDLFNANENMHCLLSCFGKHYNFFILCSEEDLS